LLASRREVRPMDQDFLESLRLLLGIFLVALKLRSALRSGNTNANEKTRR
jgi:hypothetical protein